MYPQREIKPARQDPSTRMRFGSSASALSRVPVPIGATETQTHSPQSRKATAPGAGVEAALTTIEDSDVLRSADGGASGHMRTPQRVSPVVWADVHTVIEAGPGGHLPVDDDSRKTWKTTEETIRATTSVGARAAPGR